MAEPRRFGIADVLLLLLIVAVAGGARAWYLWVCADAGSLDAPLRVQDPRPGLALPAGAELRGKINPTELDALVHNLKEHSWYGSLAPFAGAEEQTAHTAPGYPWLLSLLERSPLDLGPVDRTVRWVQCGLGALTAGLYFLFALIAFRSLAVAVLAGLLCALHPFWIFNTAEIDDGALTAFLLGLVLFLGARGGQRGGPLTGLLYGLTLAGLALVRAALFPFAVAGILWFLLRCRSLKGGWLYAAVAFLGFLIGLAPWTVRNFMVPVLGDLVPVSDSTYLHLWMGNHPGATGGPQTESAMLAALARARGEDVSTVRAELARIQNQKERYGRLAPDVWKEVRDNPAGTLRRRMWAGLCFFFGESWLEKGPLARVHPNPEHELPAWLNASYPALLQGTLLGMLLLGALGWRWTYAWRREAMPTSVAVVWMVLPYLLSHGEALSGPRLPLDGVLLTYAAFALIGLVPGIGSALRDGARDSVPV